MISENTALILILIVSIYMFYAFGTMAISTYKQGKALEQSLKKH
jgi:hypothetical protein